MKLPFIKHDVTPAQLVRWIVCAAILAVWIFSPHAYAQTTCQRYENPSLSWTFEGTQAAMCESGLAAYEAAYPALAPMTVAACTANQVDLVRTSNGVHYLMAVYDGGACQNEPDPDPEPTPGATAAEVVAAWMQYPTAEQASTAYVWGFSVVVVAYLAGWGVGAVLNTIKRNL